MAANEMLFFPVFFEDRKKIQRLSKDQKADLWDALFAYAMDGEITESADVAFQNQYETMTERIQRMFEKKGKPLPSHSHPDQEEEEAEAHANTNQSIDDQEKKEAHANTNQSESNTNNIYNIYNTNRERLHYSKGAVPPADSGNDDRQLIIDALERQDIPITDQVEKWVDAELAKADIGKIMVRIMSPEELKNIKAEIGVKC